MSRNVHGGSLPFVAVASIDQIARREVQLDALEFRANPLDASDDQEPSVAQLAPCAGVGSKVFTAVLDKKALGALRRFESGGDAEAVTDGTRDPGRKRSPAFYFRIMGACGPESGWGEANLRALANAIGRDEDSAITSQVPAAYTYLGQFIAHDLTHMRAADDKGDAINVRSHALDLDSLFDTPPPGVLPQNGVIWKGGLALGQTTGGRYQDLPRDWTGCPAISDARNDNNLSVAQMTVAMIRFHHCLCDLMPCVDPEDVKCQTRRHVQSVVLHDYLRRIIHPDVYDDILPEGNPRGVRRVIFPTGKHGGSVLPDLFQVPIEFAAACFRFGHSMVRAGYDWNKKLNFGVSGYELRRQTHMGVITSEGPRLNGDWPVDWLRLLDLSGHDSARNSAAIDTRISSDLRRLDDPWLPPDSQEPDLALITLLRGRKVGLPSGQSLHRHVAAHAATSLLSEIPLTGDEIVAGLRRGSDLDGVHDLLKEEAPLWFYVLREAEVRGCSGKHLGTLASRVVMETIHAAIEASPDSILSGEPFDVLPGLKASDRSRFTLQDLITAGRTQT